MGASASHRSAAAAAPVPESPSQPQDLVLTIFGAHVRRSGTQVWSGGMVAILGELGFTTGAARAALARLVKRELLARTRAGRHAFYSLTPRADALLAEGDRRIFGFGRGAANDDSWTVLWHAIPERDRVTRSRLASRLRFLGFGALQDATWIAAHDREREVRTLVEQLGVGPHVSVVIGRMPDGPAASMVAQAWRLDDVLRRYESFLSDFPDAAAALWTECPPRDAFRLRTLMLHRFRGFPFLDPELPRAIDPVAEIRDAVLARFAELYAALEDGASHHFWTTVAGGRPGDQGRRARGRVQSTDIASRSPVDCFARDVAGP